MLAVSNVIYGNFRISALFSALIRTPTLRRLSNVHQSGAVFLVNDKIRHHRLEHSIGVMLLIKLLGGSELEQLAGLLHDVSHTAFSHVGDYVMDNVNESYHEQVFQEMILQSEIPDILNQYGYDINTIINGEFPILEQPLPHLCADRIDYTLRDAFHFGIISRLETLQFIKHLSLEENKIVLKDHEQAAWINHVSKQLNEQVYQYPLYVFANTKLASVIKTLLKQGILSMSDLFQDDTFLLNKIRSNLEGLKAIRDIKSLKDYSKFLKNIDTIPIKKRYLNVCASF